MTELIVAAALLGLVVWVFRACTRERPATVVDADREQPEWDRL